MTSITFVARVSRLPKICKLHFTVILQQVTTAPSVLKNKIVFNKTWVKR